MKKRILIVEDSALIALEISETLKNLGYEVVGEAGSGAEAIAMAGDQRPDLVLMDIILKGKMDGIEAAERIYNSFDIPVIYLTAHSDEATLNRALKTNAFGYLIKPFNDRELYSNIEMALHKHRIIKKVDKEPKESVDSTLNFVSEPVMATDESGVIIRINSAAEEFTGLLKADVTGKNFFSLFSGNRERLLNTMDSLKETTYDGNSSLVKIDGLSLSLPDGGKRVFSVNVGYSARGPGSGGSGEFFIIPLTVDTAGVEEPDIPQGCERILDRLKSPVFVIDEDLHIVHFNRAFADLCRLAGITLKKNASAHRILPSYVFGGESGFREVFNTGLAYTLGRSWKLSKGFRIFNIEFSPINDEDAKPIAAVIMTDITKDLELEDKIKKLSEGFRDYSKNLEQISDLCSGLMEPINRIKKCTSKLTPSSESMHISESLMELSEIKYNIDMEWLKYEKLRKLIDHTGSSEESRAANNSKRGKK